MIRVEKLERHTVPGLQKITVYTRDINEVDKLIAKVGEKPLELILKPITHKRSLDANAYLWVLCDKIAQILRSTKEEVYREHIKRVGCFQDIAVVKGAPTGAFMAEWEHKGDGWIAEVRPDCKIKGCNKVRVYFGSSSYDSKQFARLVDDVVDEADRLGIETATPDEIRRMMEVSGWDGSS